MSDTDVGNLTLLEEAMADHVAGALMIRIGEQSDRCIDMRKIVLRLRDLSLIRCDPSMDLGALLFQ